MVLGKVVEVRVGGVGKGERAKDGRKERPGSVKPRGQVYRTGSMHNGLMLDPQ